MTWRESVTPLRNGTFAWYFGARVADTFGTMMAGLALTFAVLDISGSATAVGQVLAAQSIPLVVFLLLGGVVADRVPRTLLLQTSNLAAALTQGVLAALVISGRAELWMVIVLAGLNGTVDAVSFPAQAGMVPQLVDRTELQAANALLSLSRGVVTVLAPSAAGLLVMTVGPGWALAGNAMLWLVSAVLLSRVAVPPRPRAKQRASTVDDLRQGWEFFARTTWLWVVVATFSALNAISTGAWHTVGPVVAQGTIGVQGWGLVISAQSAGLLLMTVVLLRVRLRRPLLSGMVGISLLSLPMVALGTAPHLVLLIAVALVAGAGAEVFTIGWNVAMQEHVDEAMLSRAYSYDALGSFAAMPVGQLLYGPLADRFGAGDVLVWSGGLYATVSLLALASSTVRTLPRADAGPTSVGELTDG